MTNVSPATVVSYDDYDALGMILEGRSAVNGDGRPRFKFTGKERDAESKYDYFGARYYDSRVARWMSVDPLAGKYPFFSPYCYAANNPLFFVDPSGDSIDVSRLTSKQLDAFNKNLPEMMKSKQFASIWNTLSSSKAIYSIAVTPQQKQGALYQARGDQTGSGGTLSFQSAEGFSSAFTFAHEAFHAYQHDQNNVGRVVGIEIEGNLFANSVANELGQPMFFGPVGNDPSADASFNQAFEKLQFGRTFDQQSWRTANELFKASGWNDGRYNAYGVKIYNPLIRRFYPLFK
jgi:RHS repeat-associated protein